MWSHVVLLWHQVTMIASEQHLYQAIVFTRKLATGSKHDHLFCYCPLVGILFEVLIIVIMHLACHKLNTYNIITKTGLELTKFNINNITSGFRCSELLNTSVKITGWRHTSKTDAKRKRHFSTLPQPSCQYGCFYVIMASLLACIWTYWLVHDQQTLWPDLNLRDR